MVVKDEKEDVSSYWKTLRKRQKNGVWRKKRDIVLSEKLAFEGTADISQDTLRSE